jgi:hypothetical protein
MIVIRITLFVLALALSCAGCARPHDDGADNLWRIPGLQQP